MGHEKELVFLAFAASVILITAGMQADMPTYVAQRNNGVDVSHERLGRACCAPPLAGLVAEGGFSKLLPHRIDVSKRSVFQNTQALRKPADLIVPSFGLFDVVKITFSGNILS
ncbi:hypothetical protein [Burkholderia singularis]|uniref:hypothetical protein n=1 Tax=Burkholderia singularis TaxID=1503053 RepID=UPI00118171ED|nr:hypothetical protein [Burkholderia singularis]